MRRSRRASRIGARHRTRPSRSPDVSSQQPQEATAGPQDHPRSRDAGRARHARRPAILTTPAPASHTPVGNATFPGSNYRCSDGQKTFLKAAWQEAYSYTERTEQMIDHIAAQPTEDERRRLWEQDFRGYGSPGDWRRMESPPRYFGAYDRARLGRVQRALDDARRRFEGKTMYLVTCSTVCAKKKSTSVHHAVKGRVVTCSVFWSRARDKSLTAQEQLAASAFTLAHEVFHHIFVKVDGVWAALGDYHGDGVGGHTDQKYYGIENVTTLAREKANWAVRNNDSYAYFAQSAGVIAPAEPSRACTPTRRAQAPARCIAT